MRRSCMNISGGAYKKRCKGRFLNSLRSVRGGIFLSTTFFCSKQVVMAAPESSVAFRKFALVI